LKERRTAVRGKENQRLISERWGTVWSFGLTLGGWRSVFGNCIGPHSVIRQTERTTLQETRLNTSDKFIF